VVFKATSAQVVWFRATWLFAIACGDGRAGLCPCCYGSSLFFNFQVKHLVLVADGASLIRPTVYFSHLACVGWISAASSTIGNTQYIMGYPFIPPWRMALR